MDETGGARPGWLVLLNTFGLALIGFLVVILLMVAFPIPGSDWIAYLGAALFAAGYLVWENRKS
ncbi:hypothetical protein [Halocatena halophila]|uniref:hypothetical protein n=1 Tax=Halocatena halophila TaxID=2814576 RepID=UPI002ED09E93